MNLQNCIKLIEKYQHQLKKQDRHEKHDKKKMGKLSEQISGQKTLKIVQLRNTDQESIIKEQNNSFMAEDYYPDEQVQENTDELQKEALRQKERQRQKWKRQERQREKEIEKKQIQKERQRETERQREKQQQKRREKERFKERQKERLKPRVQIKMPERKQLMKKQAKKITKIKLQPQEAVPLNKIQCSSPQSTIQKPLKANSKFQISGKKIVSEQTLLNNEPYRNNAIPSQKIPKLNSDIILNKPNIRDLKPKGSQYSEINLYTITQTHSNKINKQFIEQKDEEKGKANHVPIPAPFKRTFQQLTDRKTQEKQQIPADIISKKRNLGYYNPTNAKSQSQNIEQYHYQHNDYNKISSPFSEDEKLIKNVKSLAIEKAMNIASQRKQKEEELKSHILRYNQKVANKKESHQKQQMKELYNTILANQKKRDEFIVQKVNKKFKPFQNAHATIEMSSYSEIGFPNIFNKTKRYKKCEQFLEKQKRISLRNLLRKESGKQITKQKVKIVQVLDQQLFQSQLGSVKVLNIQAEIDRLQMLIKVNYGWVAMGKSRMHGLFKVDVNLLPEYAWKILEEIYINEF